MVEKQIGKRIQKCRKNKGLTQEQVAEKVNLSTNYFSAVERGIYSVKIDKLVEIINCLECSADEIFADVVKEGYKTRASILADEISELPKNEQERILEVVETLVKSAKRN